MTSISPPPHTFYHPSVHATATDRSPVFMLPSPEDPLIASDLARMQKLRNAEINNQLHKPVFVLGTRTSKLAMVQTELVKKNLEKIWPGREIRISGMLSAGDKNLTQPLYLLGGKALWTKELEVALLEGAVDAIVHSLKDVPTTFPEGCELGAVLEREDPSDALVMKAGLPYKTLDEIPDGSIIGTSSVRRVAQLRKMYPELKFADVRGNLQTRLAKLDNPDSTYTALILASAGLIRLGQSSRITASVVAPVLYYAVSQGAIGIEIRQGDAEAAEFVGALEDWKTGWTCRAERGMLRKIEGGCSIPLGCTTSLVDIEVPSSPTSSIRSINKKASVEDTHSARITLTGTITSLSGISSVIASLTRTCYSITDAEILGTEVAEQLIQNGGRAILEELGRHIKEVGGEEGKEIPMESNRALGIDMTYSTESKPIHLHHHQNHQDTSAISDDNSPSDESLMKSPRPRSLTYPGDVCKRPAGW